MQQAPVMQQGAQGMQVVAVNGRPVPGAGFSMQPNYPQPAQSYLPPFSTLTASVEQHAAMIPWYVWLGVGLYVGAKYLKW
jgi:hypothetical protein